MHPHFSSLTTKENSKSLRLKTFTLCHTFEASDLLGNGTNANFVSCVQKEALQNCQDRRCCAFICMMGLSSVLYLPILSLYPDSGGIAASQLSVKIFNGLLSPRLTCIRDPTRLPWCREGNTTDNIDFSFRPNHVIPVFIFTSTATISSMTAPAFSKTKQMKLSFPSKPPSISFLPSHFESSPCISTTHPFDAKHDSLSEPPSSLHDFDIGCFYEKATTLDDGTKLEIVEKVWKPDANFAFPLRPFGKNNRKFNHLWLATYSWLTYSRHLDAAFCLPCVLFGRRIGKNSLKLQRLVNSPFHDWSSAAKRFKEHEQASEIHKTSLLTMNIFLNVMKSKVKPVNQICNESVDKVVTGNMQKLLSILKTVILCARQNIPLRGHRDDSSYYGKEDCGNFQALLDFRVDSGDKILESHFETAPKNATYRSKTTQNDLIICSAEFVNSKIIEEIRASQFYSILADEVLDCSNKEQMSLAIRYIDAEGNIQERFLKFIRCDSGTTGKALANQVVKCIKDDLGLDLKYCRGQCYDGAGNMAGKCSGLSARILELNSLALYTHCMSHRLNLVVASSCNIQSIQNVMDKMREITNFFGMSPKRQLLLDEAVKRLLPSYKHNKLSNVCQTRWIARIDGMTRFIEMYPAVLESLLIMLANTDKEWKNSTSDAYGYASVLRDFDFIIILVILNNCLGYLRSGTIQLQGAHIDIIQGLKEISIIKKSLQTARTLIDCYFNSWFAEAECIANQVGSAVDFPRISAIQTKRSNAPAKTAHNYYKRNVAIPFLDHLLREISVRFSDKHAIAYRAISIIPAVMKHQSDSTGSKRHHSSLSQDLQPEIGMPEVTSSENFSMSSITSLVKIQRIDKPWKRDLLSFCQQYENDLPDPSLLSHEVDNWDSAWNQCTPNDLPESISETLKLTNPISFPSIYTVLKILGVLPITSCTCERSASSIRILKTYLRSTMTQDRLNGLATLYT